MPDATEELMQVDDPLPLTPRPGPSATPVEAAPAAAGPSPTAHASRSRSPSRRSDGSRSRNRSRSRSRSRSEGEVEGGRGRYRANDQGRKLAASRGRHDSRPRGRSGSRYSDRSSSYDSRGRSRLRSWSRSRSRSRTSTPPGHRQARRKTSRSPSLEPDPDAPRKREEDDQREQPSQPGQGGKNVRRDPPKRSNQDDRYAPHSFPKGKGKGKERARSPHRSFPRNRPPLQRTRSPSPTHDPCYRFRFILPFAELVTILIGSGGWRAKEIKFFAGLSRLTFYQSEEFQGPLGELIGSREAIQDGLKAIAFAVDEEMQGMSPLHRERCGNVSQWTSFGEEFMEDLEMSKHAFLIKVRNIDRDNPSAARTGWQNEMPRTGNGFERGANDQSHGQNGQSGQSNVDRQNGPPKENIWRASAWGLPVTTDDVREDYHPGPPPPGDLASRLDVRPSDLSQPPDRSQPPDWTITIPRVAERYLIGHKGAIIQGIEKRSKTRCFVERRTVEPCLLIWGVPSQRERVLSFIDPIILQHEPTWRTGVERDKFGPGWGGREGGNERESGSDNRRHSPPLQAPLRVDLPEREHLNDQNLPSPPTQAYNGSSPSATHASATYGLFSPPHSSNYSSNTSAGAGSDTDMAAPTGEVEVASQAKVKLTPIALAKEASELSAEERAEFLLALSEILGPVPSAHTLTISTTTPAAPNGTDTESDASSSRSSTNSEAEAAEVAKRLGATPARAAERSASASTSTLVARAAGPILGRASPSPAPVASSSTSKNKRKQSDTDLEPTPRPSTRTAVAAAPLVPRALPPGATPTALWPRKQKVEIRIPWRKSTRIVVTKS